VLYLKRELSPPKSLQVLGTVCITSCFSDLKPVPQAGKPHIFMLELIHENEFGPNCNRIAKSEHHPPSDPRNVARKRY
jgi:hypothetical protein